jgi:adenosylcobinamide kinase/adenosylcobinamide-phosphate guanylyltransferase
MIAKVTLILGGIRSGKTHLAEELALGYGRRPVYLATSRDADEEMRTRIRTSQRRRGDRFELIEEGYDLRSALNRCAGRTVLVDSLGDHLVNRLSRQTGPQVVDQIWENDRGYLNEILSIQKEKEINLILVSHEVGMAPVPANPSERVFQQLMGHWNRHLAHLSHRVMETLAGIPRVLRQNRAARFRLGAPACFMPGDLLQNLLYLRQHVDDIQLCYDQSPLGDPVVSVQELNLLRSLKTGDDVSYSVHMPASPAIHEDPNLMLDRAARLIDSLAILEPVTHTFHYCVPATSTQGMGDQMSRDAYVNFFTELKRRYPGVPFSLENIKTPLRDLDFIIDACAISYAIDLGHLLKEGHPLSEVTDRLGQAAVVHLHHASDQKDHLPLPRFAPYFSLLHDFAGLVTIENHHLRHLETSLEAVSSYF